MKKNPELSIIIPQYNTKNLLLDCLKSIFEKSKDLDFEVIVVDNGSSDGSVKAVKVEFPFVKLITNKKNLGYAKANNQGVKKARGEYVLFLNSDTVLLDNAFKKSLSFLQDNRKYSVLGCKLLNKDKTLQPSCGFLPHLWQVFLMMFFLDDLPILGRFINSYQKNNPSFYKNIHQVGWATGAFLLVKRKVLDKAGLFDEEFFMYAEEVEWFFRVKKAGFKTCFYPKASIIHLKGKSSLDGFKSAVLGEYKGLLLLYKKHKKPWQRFLLRLMLKLGAFLRVVLFGILGNNKKRKIYEKAFKLA